MNQALKRKSLKTLLPYIIVCAILAVLLLGLSGKGLVLMARGPVSMDGQRPDRGEYVSFDASQVIVAFASLTSKSDSGSTTLETYYLLPVGNTYLAVIDKKGANKEVLDKAMEQSHEYYMGDLTTLTELGALQGTVTALEADMDSYMADCIENYTLPGYVEGGDTLALIVPLQIELERVGLLGKALTLALGGIGLVLLLAALALLLLALTGFYQKKANAYIAQWNTPEEADGLYAQAEQLERVRVGDYVWYQKGACTKVIKTSQLVWGYSEVEPLVVSKYRWPVTLYDAGRNKTVLGFIDKKNREKLLSAIADQGHPFVRGNSAEIAAKFQSDMDDFLAMADEKSE